MIYVEILWLTHYKFFLKDLFLAFCTRTMIHSHTKVIWEAQFLSSFRLSCSKEWGFCEICCCSERELVLLAVCHSQRALHIYQLPHLFFFPVCQHWHGLEFSVWIKPIFCFQYSHPRMVFPSDQGHRTLKKEREHKKSPNNAVLAGCQCYQLIQPQKSPCLILSCTFMCCFFALN